MKNKKEFKIDFIGIGAPKCASTWVYRCLLEHPEICGPYIKETNFFLTIKLPFGDKVIGEYEKGINYYYKKYFSHCDESCKKGEFSVYYMYDEKALQIIKEKYPEAKIIVCLRDPVKRAHSLYWYLRSFSLEEDIDSFEEAVERRPSLYIDNGLYFKHLSTLLKYFPKEDVGIFFVEDLKKDSLSFIQGVYDFLGVNAKFTPPSIKGSENAAKKTKNKLLRWVLTDCVALISRTLKKMRLYFIVDFLRKIGLEKTLFYFNHKINVMKFSKPPIKEGNENKLRDIFRKDINNLEKLINKDLSSWK